MSELAKAYEPQPVESKWYQHWLDEKFFVADPARVSATRPAYSIVIPPPNVTGSLHMGHAFNNTVMDLLIRHARMSGRDTLWQVGTDHAGIATQMVVERQLAAQGQSRHDLGREAFLDRVWQWKAESGGTINKQMRRLGNSVDWNRDRFTMDPGMSQAVQEAFIRLHEAGLHLAALYDLNHSAAQTLASELSINAVRTPAEVAATSSIVVTVISDDAAMRSIFSEHDPASLLVHAKDRLFINCATLSPRVHHDIERLVTAQGGACLEACMASSITQARQGTLYLMCGEPDVFAQARPLLEALGTTVRYIGPTGEAAKVKALVNMVMNSNTAAFAAI